jgi:hypothetical protein
MHASNCRNRNSLYIHTLHTLSTVQYIDIQLHALFAYRSIPTCLDAQSCTYAEVKTQLVKKIHTACDQAASLRVQRTTYCSTATATTATANAQLPRM